jgi:hypothetical protein
MVPGRKEISSKIAAFAYQGGTSIMVGLWAADPMGFPVLIGDESVAAG